MPYTPPDYSAPLPDAGLLRARERAIALLTDRYADESLGEAEFEARLKWLTSADDVTMIGHLMAELSAPRAVARPAAHAIAAREVRILAVMSSTSRTGGWTVPPLLAVRAVMSEVRLDLRFANLPPAGEIDLTAIMANVRIIVPPEVVVECGVSPFMGAVRNEAEASGWPDYGAPRLRVTGTCVMAEVRIDVLPRLQ
ncbi:MAG: hypothetical protein JWN79_1322 [Gemmatimonadetes bacterium]|nr:hypothetical protein [Gemmatimonadota bacterium]